MAKHSMSAVRRRNRTRKGLRGHGNSRPRLSVYRSNTYIYAQIIDDEQGRTLAAASSREPSLKADTAATCTKAAAEAVGKTVAERALTASIKTVVFDRGAYLYHGRIKSLADAARAAGLAF